MGKKAEIQVFLTAKTFILSTTLGDNQFPQSLAGGCLYSSEGSLQEIPLEYVHTYLLVVM